MTSDRLLAAITIFALIIVSSAYPSTALRTVSSLEGISASMTIQQLGSAATAMNVAIPAVSINDIRLNGTDYKEVALPQTEHLWQAETSEEGKPSMPALTSFLAIPYETGVEISVTYSGYEDVDNIDIAPTQPSQSEANPEEVIPFTIDQQAYATDAFYPGELAIADQPVIMRDIRMLPISVYPAQYNPARRQLRIYRDLTVNVSYTGQVINPKTVHHRYISDGFYPIYRSLVANFDQFITATEVKRGGYLIITKPMFADSLKQLAIWKHKKGYSVHIAPTTEILPGGNPSQTQIYNYIKNAYTTWDDPPEYVMIVGDKDNLTSSGVTDYPYSTYASDNHYGCVEGTDYIPDIFVARLSVDYMTDLVRALAKVMKYDSRPFMADSSYWVHGLSAAHTGFQSARTTVLWVRQALLEHGFARVETSLTSGSDPRLSGYFNTGVSIISYRGYAGTDGWWGPTFTSSDLMNLTNNQKLGVMASLVCGTGDFSYECFGETWLRMGYSADSLKGGPAFYGVSDHLTHTKWNNPIMVGYYFGLLNEGACHFAAAAVRGKMQLYRTFPRYRGAGQYVELYFNTYNMLGDPELEVRTAIPRRLIVNHPEAIALGLNQLNIQVTSAGAPIPGAYVTLFRGDYSTDEIYAVGQTDSAGRVYITFDAPSAGAMSVTVSGWNLYPYQGQIQIISSEITVGQDSFIIDDDATGPSVGNGDSLASPNEIVELGIRLKNYGVNLVATGLTARLEAIDSSLIQVLDGNRVCADLAPESTGMVSQSFLIRILPEAQNGDLGRLKLTAIDQANRQWYSTLTIPITAASFVVTNAAFPGGNGRLDPGDTSQMVLTISNRGNLAAAAVTGRITTENDYTTVLADMGNFGDIAIGGSGTNVATPMTVSADLSSFKGGVVGLILHLITAGGAESIVPFNVTVGTVASTDPVGPDAYGYYMYDNTDSLYAPHPHYQWVEIEPTQGGHGQRVNFSVTDDKSVLITLPFNFVYYDKVYTKLIVCTNGFVSPDTFKYDVGGNYWNNFFNWPIPDPGNAQAQISPFWDDLEYTGSNYGIYTWYDTTNHKFYIEWYHMNNRNSSSTETFQLVITDPAYYPNLTGDSEILFLYNTIFNNDTAENYASVGFESWDEKMGLEYTNDNFYAPGAAILANGRAILITTSTGRGGIKGNVDLRNGAHNENARVTASSGQYRITPASGDYWLRNVPAGNLSLIAEAHGYFPSRIDSLEVTVNRIITQMDFALDQCPIPGGLVASQDLQNRIELNWVAINHQYAAGYNIFRSNWQDGRYIKLNTAPVETTFYEDRALPDTGSYWYYISGVFTGEDWTAESFGSAKASGQCDTITGLDENKDLLPQEFSLSQNYPNPFNAATIIRYTIPRSCLVTIDIFDILGRKVETVANGLQQGGNYQIIWNGANKSSGMYFYRIQADNKVMIKKMALLK